MNRTQFNQELRKLEPKFTALIQAEIKRQKLIKSGLMYASTILKLTNQVDNIKFEVKSTKYFVFVDSDFKVLKIVMKSAAWKALIKQLTKAFASFQKSKIIRLSK